MSHPPFLWLRTVRHFPLSALWHRLRLKIGKATYRPGPTPATLSVDWNHFQQEKGEHTPLLLPSFNRWQLENDPNFQARIETQAQKLVESDKGEILNQPFKLFPNPHALADELLTQTPLWRENYNYLEFLLPLIWMLQNKSMSSTQKNTKQTLLETQLRIFWALDWKSRMWSTYGVSRRLLVYCECLPILAALSTEVQQLFWDNFYQDSRYLARFLEWDVQGNHLIRNLTAWLAASVVLSRLPGTRLLAQQWQKTLEQLLPRIFSEQILPDGFHFERTPMYHAWVTQDLLECLAWLKCLPDSKEAEQALQPLATRMLATGQAILHADKQIPLSGDASLPQAPDFCRLLEYAAQVTNIVPGTHDANAALRHFPQAGFAVFRNETPQASLVLDCGDFAPKNLPAHAHCDLGSFELHDEHGPLIVDSGVSEYCPSLLRDYFRSTAAHNTIWFPGEEQAELWSSFRVAEYPRFLGCQTRKIEESAAGIAAQSWVNLAYENHNGTYTHRRTIRHYVQRFWVIEDQVNANDPKRPCWSLLHVHPDGVISVKNSQTPNVGYIVSNRLLILPFGANSTEWTNQAPWRENLNLYSAGFNLAQPGQIIALSPDLSHTFGWVLVPFPPAFPPQWTWQNDTLILDFPEDGARFHFTRCTNAFQSQRLDLTGFQQT
jgi:uncharacterized heparinase superfamily protein